MNSKYKKYKKIKSLLKSKAYKGYPLHLVLGSYIGMLIWKPTKLLYLRYFLLNPSSLINIESNKVLLTYSTKRSDYIELMRGYFENEAPQYVRIENSKLDIILGFPSSVYSFFKAVLFLKSVKCKTSDKVLLLCVVSIALKVISQLEKKELNCDKYIAFNSSYLIEAFLSFYFRNKGIPTYSLQHGIYFNYVNTIPFDIMNYENVCADKLLVWGEYSKEQVEPFLPNTSEAVVYGYPYETSSFKNKSESILVLLPRDIYLSESLQLLTYLKRYKKNYVIRPHPSIKLSVSEHIEVSSNISLDTNNTLRETLMSTQFEAVIGFNSTSIFEASLYKQNVLLFKTDNQEFDNPGFKEFNISSDLYFKLDSFEQNICSNYFFKEVKEYDGI
jgi:hypothetical protein